MTGTIIISHVCSSRFRMATTSLDVKARRKEKGKKRKRKEQSTAQHSVEELLQKVKDLVYAHPHLHLHDLRTFYSYQV